MTQGIYLPMFLLLLVTAFHNANCDEKQPNNCVTKSSAHSEIITYLASRLTDEIGLEGNFLFSPLSISAALAMLYVGAEGSTKSQMGTALQYNISSNTCPDIKILEGNRNLFLALHVDNELLSLVIANTVFIQRGFRVSPDYTFRVRQYFNSEINYVDFANEEQASMRTINQWVSDKTRTQIEKLLNEPLDTATLMVLANVIYFKGLWEHPFQETWNNVFYTIDGTRKIVPFMRLQETFYYYYDERSGNSFLEMDYVGGNVTMLLILPRSSHRIPSFHLSTGALCNIRSKMSMRSVMVGLPRFQLQYRRELSKDMERFGMTKLFSDSADLSGISEQNDLHVSLMIHKAVIEVNEAGSRASAISAVGIDARLRPSQEATFWANHPFLFYIIDKRVDTILFVGRVMDP